MRLGILGLALKVQEALGRNPHAGDLFAFRGRRGDLLKVLWHDGLGMSLYAKRLEKGRFIWPSPAEGVVALLSAQLGYLLEGIDWGTRNAHGVRNWQAERIFRHTAGPIYAVMGSMETAISEIDRLRWSWQRPR